MKRRHRLTAAMTVLALALQPAAVLAQSATGGIATPRQAYGFDIGDNYQLASYAQLASYWRTLEQQSDRIQLTTIGKTAEGRDQVMAVISSAENLARLDHYRDIARRMAQGEGLTDDQALALAAEGKAIVWIDGGLHSTEVVGSQQLSQLVYEMVSGEDPETRRIRDNVILLVANANPDGTDLVTDWYMRKPNPEEREFESLPRLYHHYVGHDNNRDFVASNMPETANINRVFYREWFPQIVYNHHQTGPAGMVVFIPTHRDPANPNLDPLSLMGLENVGAAMNTRLIAEGKPGGGQRSVAPYTNWASTTLRSNALFHNSIGVITEINGHPTPKDLPLVIDNQMPRNDLPMPIAPQTFTFQQAIDYSMSMNRAVLDYASRNADHLLFGAYTMARNGIEAGQQDHWTINRRRIEALREAAANQSYTPRSQGWGMAYSRDAIDPALYDTVLRDPAARDARAYVLSADQADMPRVVEFVNALIKSGLQVERASAPFDAGGKRYPAGSFVVQTGQPYRAMVLENFEPQFHPDDIPYEGAPPIPPHNMTGYTLAYQTGVSFDRVLEAVSGPFERIADELPPPPAAIVGSGSGGFLISHEINRAFELQNRLLAAGKPVFWLTRPTTAEGVSFGAGAIYVPAGEGVREIVEQGAREMGVPAYAVAARSDEALALRPIRIGLVDLYGGVMDSGWTRWILEDYDFPFEVIYPQDLDAGNLNARFDVILFANDALPPPPDPDRPSRTVQPPATDIPEEYRNRLGHITPERTIPQLDSFVRNGGSLIAFGNATRIATLMNLPVEDALVETAPDGTVRHLPRSAYYVPGSILSSRVDNASPLGYGMPTTADIYYYNSPAFRLKAGATGSTVSWFEGDDPLRSGWAWGAHHLNGAANVVEVTHGRGRVFLMAPQVIQLAQSHGTYKFLFNGLLYGPAVTASVD